MSSQRQIEANRQNAKKSTGPRTAAGRATSALNALKSGIDSQAPLLPFESAEALELLKAEYHLQHKPQTPEMRAAVDSLVKNEWLQRRFFVLEAMLIDRKIANLFDPKPGQEVAHAVTCLDGILDRLQTRINSAERNYRAALKLLLELKKLTEQITSEELASFLRTPPDSFEHTPAEPVLPLSIHPETLPIHADPPQIA